VESLEVNGQTGNGEGIIQLRGEGGKGGVSCAGLICGSVGGGGGGGGGREGVGVACSWSGGGRVVTGREGGRLPEEKRCGSRCSAGACSCESVGAGGWGVVVRVGLVSREGWCGERVEMGGGAQKRGKRLGRLVDSK